MLSRNILSWLILLLILATVTRSEHYHIVPVDSTSLCYDYRNGTCFTLEQLVQTLNLLSGGGNLTLSFLPGNHVLTEQLLIRNFSHVEITGQNKSTTVVGFHSNGAIRFVSLTKLSIEHLGFVGVNVGPPNSHQGVIIVGSHDVYINDCYFMDFGSNQLEKTHIAKTKTATIESTLFMNNTGQALHVEADDVYITNSEFTKNSGGAVYIKSNNSLINNTGFNYNSAENGGAVEVVSGTVGITRCTFTNNKASEFGGAIAVVSSSVSISNSELTNNNAYSGDGGGAISVTSGSSVSISNSKLTNNRADFDGGAILVDSGSVSISNSELTNNSADGGGAIHVCSGSSVSISNSELTNNSAYYGGAIEVELGSVSISNSELTNNSANFGKGGAIHVLSSVNVSISNSELTNNSAGHGGAIHVESGSSVSISNSELTNNSADHGGAIYVHSGSSVSISNSELTNNSADHGGAIYVDHGGAIYVYSSVSISNSELTHNSANDSGGAIFVYSGNVSISNSELMNNNADGGGAIIVYSGNVSISNSTLTNNSANDGGAIGVDAGNVSISNSTLTNNSADNGGAIAVDSGNVSISNSTLTNNSADVGGAIFFSSGNMSISNSELTNNRANNSGAIGVNSGNVSISNSTLTNNSATNDGGAIDVYSGIVSISNSELTNNSANDGGAIRVLYGNVSISNSELTNNIATNDGGAIIVYASNVFISNSELTNNSATGAIDVYSSNVTFIGRNIIRNNGYPVYAFNSRIEFNGPTTLSNNRGVLGGAISSDQSEIFINAGVVITNNTATSGGGIFLRESTLFVNEPLEIYHNTAHKDGGGIYAYSSRVEFQPVMRDRDGRPLPGPNTQSEIAHNIAENGGGIHAVSSTIKLTQSYVNIDSNTANASGGGVYLQQSSKLYLFKTNEEMTQDRYVKLMINNNLAQFGGGILVADDTQRSACGGGATEDVDTHTIFADCFIQTIKLNTEEESSLPNYFNTFMTNNTATQSGADIYGGLLDRCTINQNAEYEIYSNGSILDYINSTIKSSTELSISSGPVQVMFCNHSQNDYVSPKKGHAFKIRVIAVDQVGNPTNATIRSSVITKSRVGRLKEGQAEQNVSNQCTELEYNVFSQDSFAQVEVYAEGPCINLGISKQLIKISFLPCTCPIGLKPIQSDTECKCDCDPDLLQYQITNCSEENETIKLESNNNIWIEVINTTNETGYVVSNCVFDYCLKRPVNISLSNPDEQCAYNRSGVLCGECEPGLSLVLATSKCKECSNFYLFC